MFVLPHGLGMSLLLMQQFVLVSSHDTAPVCDYLHVSLNHITVDTTRSPPPFPSVFLHPVSNQKCKGREQKKSRMIQSMCDYCRSHIEIKLVKVSLVTTPPSS